MKDIVKAYVDLVNKDCVTLPVNYEAFLRTVETRQYFQDERWVVECRFVEPWPRRDGIKFSCASKYLSEAQRDALLYQSKFFLEIQREILQGNDFGIKVPSVFVVNIRSLEVMQVLIEALPHTMTDILNRLSSNGIPAEGMELTVDSERGTVRAISSDEFMQIRIPNMTHLLEAIASVRAGVHADLDLDKI